MLRKKSDFTEEQIYAPDKTEQEWAEMSTEERFDDIARRMLKYGVEDRFGIFLEKDK